MSKELMVQGVISTIEFPTTKDQQAVGKAIADLLREGWVFDGVTSNKLTLSRRWEARLESFMARYGARVPATPPITPEEANVF